MVLIDKTKQQFGYAFEDAPSTGRVCLRCDYCGREFTRAKRHAAVKDSCGDKECTVKKRYESTLLKHGKDCFSKKFIKKARLTSLSKYGTENPAQSQVVKNKIKQTSQERYGVDSYLSLPEARIKIRETSLKKYGTEYPAQSALVIDKAKQTSIKKYGDLFQRTPRWKKKVKNTLMKKYGVKNPTEIPGVMQKMEATMQRNFGVSHALQNKDVLEKAKSTTLTRYGKNNYSQTDEYREKYVKTSLERYGTEHPMSASVVKTKSMQNKLSKYGKLYVNMGKTEEEIRQWVNSIRSGFSQDVKILGGKEIDLYNDTLKIGIEYCGLFWHTELSKEPRNRSYHFQKYKKCKEKGIRLITIFEDEWKQRQQQCEGLLLSILGHYSERINARDCIVEKNNSAINDFYNNHHLQGKPPNQIVSFCLLHGTSIVGAISLSHHHRNSEVWTISRICFASGVQVVGGASRLLSACVKFAKANGIHSLITWSDNRWSEGHLYERLGFQLDAELPPDYSYVNLKRSGITNSRISKQSQKKSLTGCPANITEKEWAAKHNLARIWDCGKKRWRLFI